MLMYKLTRIPVDVFKIVLEKQKEIKIKKGTNQYSFEATLYNIIREWKAIKDKEAGI